jgi:hypothetical protein
VITESEIQGWICDALRPPSSLPDDAWCEKHYEIQRGSGKGRPQFDTLPMARIILRYMNRSLCAWVSRLVLMVSAQSVKTETVMMSLCRRIAERPVDTMFATATKDSAKELTQKALYPSIENCAPAAEFLPPVSRRAKQLLVFGHGMKLLMRGSESRIGLQGDPIGFLICDERREWKPGAIGMIRKRVRTFADALEVSMGVAGEENDELHRDFNDGSQAFLHWNCPHCRRSQPFRFGKDASTLFPDERKLGGVVWPADETTKPGGKWDYDAVERTAEYECEGCGARFKNHEKIGLLKTMHEVHRNPAALKAGLVSLHYNALYMPWASCSFGAIAVEFLKACEALKVGDIEPMKTFVTETLGEPWQTRNRKKATGAILERCGEYRMGEPIGVFNVQDKRWIIDSNTALVLTFDRQKNCLKYVIRQWHLNGAKKGASRLVVCGETPDYGTLKEAQLKWRIASNTIFGQKGRANGNVFGDDGGLHSQDFRNACITHGWTPLRGERFRYYLEKEKGTDGEEKLIRRGWRAAEFDIGTGNIAQYRATIAAWEFSSWWFKEKLYCLFLSGKGPEWLIPHDIPQEYLNELTADVLMEKKKPDGSTEQYFHESDVNDFGDDEVMQLVVADIHGITRLLPSQ